MRGTTPTREELVAEHGEDWVLQLEGLEGMDGLDLVDRAFVIRADPPYAGFSLGDAYRRAREAGECPCNLLPDFFWEHWDVYSLCDAFPCPECADDSMFAPWDDPDGPYADADEDDPEIPF